MSSVSIDIQSLMVARRLMIAEESLRAKREGREFDVEAAEKSLETDLASISGEAQEAHEASAASSKAAQAAGDNESINLSDLYRQLDELNKNPNAARGENGQAANRQTTVEFSRREEIEFTMEYRTLERVDGLVLRDAQTAETDRYAFTFKDGYSFEIKDKWSGKSTTVWGDPHVDVSDVEGTQNGEFSDLKASDRYTTFQLQDGTRVTFNALDNGIIETVDIFKGTQHLQGVGAASKRFAEEAMFSKASVSSDALMLQSSVQMGDVVRAGGDGNDWYDSTGRLIWGKTTSAPVLSRPSAVLEMVYRRSVETSLTIQQQAQKLDQQG